MKRFITFLIHKDQFFLYVISYCQIVTWNITFQFHFYLYVKIDLYIIDNYKISKN